MSTQSNGNGTGSGKTVTVNIRAEGTWLEPYRGWTFPLVKATSKRIYFLMDCGLHIGLKVNYHKRKLFNINR